MMNLETVQAGIQSLQISMMKTKTMAVAACAVTCMIGAEAVFVPMAMNSSYERYENYAAAPMVPVIDAVKPNVQSGGRYIPLTTGKRHLNSNDDLDGDGKSPVS